MMKLRLYTAPSVEPVTAAEVKAQLGINDTDSDAVITRRITEAREWCENFCNRAFLSQVWELRMEAFPSDGIIVLPRPRVNSITHVKYTNTSSVLTTISSSVYQLDGYAEPAILAPAYGQDWPTDVKDETFNAIEIRYACGYGSAADTVPGPIKEAVLLLVGHWMNQQSAVEAGVNVRTIPWAVEQLLSAYRIVEFG